MSDTVGEAAASTGALVAESLIFVLGFGRRKSENPKIRRRTQLTRRDNPCRQWAAWFIVGDAHPRVIPEVLECFLGFSGSCLLAFCPNK